MHHWQAACVIKLKVSKSASAEGVLAGLINAPDKRLGTLAAANVVA